MTKSKIRLVLIVLLLITACAPAAAPEVANAPSSQEAATPVGTASPVLPTETPIPPTETAMPTETPTPTATQTETPLPTATATSTETATPLPTNTPTAAPTATATLVPVTSAPTVTPTSSLPGNPLALTGGSYNGCPLLSPGQYTTAPNCSDCITMDLANWTMASVVAPGASLQQVSGAYELDGAIYLTFSSGESINLSSINYRYIVVIVSLSRAIETKEDSIDTQAVSPEDFLSVLAPGTTIGYINNTTYNTTAVRVAPVCGQ